MENQLVTAQLAHDSMVALVKTEKPGPAATSAIGIRRTILANAVLRTLDKALEVSSGAGFYRSAGLEQLFRDVQGVRFHPISEKQQTRTAGRHRLGLEID
jgi:alkylation response protein AidB-like acyl-CoA dehydrogenase